MELLTRLPLIARQSNARCGSQQPPHARRSSPRLAAAAASRYRMRAAARRWHCNRTRQPPSRRPRTAAADCTTIECTLPWRQLAATAACAPAAARRWHCNRTHQPASRQHICCPLTGAADCTAIACALPCRTLCVRTPRPSACSGRGVPLPAPVATPPAAAGVAASCALRQPAASTSAAL